MSYASAIAHEPAPAAVALVIEDDADIREALCEVLAASGYAVLAASGGAEALRLLDAGERPGLILMDLMMPGMDGWTLLGALRAHGLAADVPIVVTSAAGVEALESARREGASATLAKPFDVSRMLRLLDRLRPRALH